MDKEWEKLEKISAWNVTSVKSKKQVINQARASCGTVHFASLMDICHLKNAELEAKHQKYKSRVVLRCDIVKDNSSMNKDFQPCILGVHSTTLRNKQRYCGQLQNHV